MKVEGYVCNNPKCNAWGSARYIENEGEMEITCKYCNQERTPLLNYEYKEPEVSAKDVMPNVITKGFTHKMGK